MTSIDIFSAVIIACCFFSGGFAMGCWWASRGRTDHDDADQGWHDYMQRNRLAPPLTDQEIADGNARMAALASLSADPYPDVNGVCFPPTSHQLGASKGQGTTREQGNALGAFGKPRDPDQPYPIINPREH